MQTSTLLHYGKALALAAAFTFTASLALADTIEGNWKTQSGETAAITKCGGSFCIKLKTGDFYFSQNNRDSETQQIEQDCHQKSIPQSTGMSF